MTPDRGRAPVVYYVPAPRARSAGNVLAKIILWLLALAAAPIVLAFLFGVVVFIVGAIEAYG